MVMDEKQDCIAQLEAGTLVELYRPLPPSRTQLVLNFIKSFFVTLALLYTLFVAVDVWNNTQDDVLFVPASPPRLQKLSSGKIPLEAHIMSKCPDARDCLRDLIVPVMANVSDMVDLKISYIGSYNEREETVECKHGPTECLGNILELCAAEQYPDPRVYLGFTMCMSNNYESIPQKELVHSCALEQGMDPKKLDHCTDMDYGVHGMDLLRNSVARSANANVTYSCTVRLDDDVRCIRDGGEWKNCPGGHEVEDLVADIERLYAKRQSCH